MNEAVVLAGGKGLRLKGQIEVPKPFLIVDTNTGETLLDSQIKWLVAYGFEHIILALSRENFRYMRVNYPAYLNIPYIDTSIEEDFLGTGGALKKAFDLIEEERFYCCNVDDVCFYDPNELLHFKPKKNVILVKQARLPFGAVEFEKDFKVTSFREKPMIDKFVSCGHYVFEKSKIEDLLPDSGDLERTLLVDLVSRGELYAYILKGEWITINTYKELLEARERLRNERV